jgi:hypothetical protein
MLVARGLTRDSLVAGTSTAATVKGREEVANKTETNRDSKATKTVGTHPFCNDNMSWFAIDSKMKHENFQEL